MTGAADPQADQTTAARHEAELVFDRFADVIRRRNGGATRGQPGYVPPLVQQIVDRHNAAVQAGHGQACAHWQPDGAPQPYVMAAWMPGVVSCRRDECTAVFLHISDEANRTCDGCGAVGVDGVKPGLIQTDAYVFMSGVCATCRPRFLGS